MGEFYIEDYIWLIVIGVFVFFVIIGYVADKTGLARKTFGKMPDSNNKKLTVNKQNEVVQAVPAFETDEMVIPTASSVNEIDNGVQMAENLESESDNLYLTNEDVYGSEGVQNDVYLNSEISEDVVSTEVPMENDYVNEDNLQTDFINSDVEALNDAVQTESNELYLNPEVTNEEDLYQPLGDLTFDKIESTNENSTEEDVWQMDDDTMKSTEENEDDLVLPSLDDLNAETDEDVWKF